MMIDRDEIITAFAHVSSSLPTESPRLMDTGEKVRFSLVLNEKRSLPFEGQRSAHYLENADFLNPDEARLKESELTGYYISISFKGVSPERFKNEEIGYLNIALVENRDTHIRLSYLDEVQFECTSKELSGIGLGSVALNLFIRLSDALRCKWSSLRVISDSPFAGKLYHKFGFALSERSIRRLQRFDISPEKFMEDTSFSRQFTPHICMERRTSDSLLESPGRSHIEHDLLGTPRRRKGEPLPITPDRIKHKRPSSSSPQKENAGSVNSEEMDVLFGSIGLSPAKSSPVIASGHSMNEPPTHEHLSGVRKTLFVNLNG